MLYIGYLNVRTNGTLQASYPLMAFGDTREEAGKTWAKEAGALLEGLPGAPALPGILTVGWKKDIDPYQFSVTSEQPRK